MGIDGCGSCASLLYSCLTHLGKSVAQLYGGARTTCLAHPPHPNHESAYRRYFTWYITSCKLRFVICPSEFMHNNQGGHALHLAPSCPTVPAMRHNMGAHRIEARPSPVSRNLVLAALCSELDQPAIERVSRVRHRAMLGLLASISLLCHHPPKFERLSCVSG
jgi:hypothetical protein